MDLFILNQCASRLKKELEEDQAIAEKQREEDRNLEQYEDYVSGRQYEREKKEQKHNYDYDVPARVFAGVQNGKNN